jgi:hypothetical protein
MTIRLRTSFLFGALLLGHALLTGAQSTAAQPAPSAKPSPAVSGDVPYSLKFQAFTIPGYPGLHSSVLAGDPGQVVLLGGRTNGLHGFAPSTDAAQAPSFPRTSANTNVYVLDLVGRKLLGQAPVTGLPQPYLSQFQATNLQYLLQDGFLYVVGGYGPDPATGTMVTLPYLSVVDFAALLKTVTTGGPLDAAFAEANMASFNHPALAITGGDLEIQNGAFLLMYGQLFNGEYTVNGGGQVQQEYSNSIRVFSIQATRGTSGIQLQVSYTGSYPNVTSGMDPDNPYHRRDLTISPALDPSGNPRIGVYGGVFKGGKMQGYVTPLYVTPGSNVGLNVTEDTTAAQLLSQYDCATLQLYSKSKGAMYSTFFGGISQFYWDPSCNCLKGDAVNLSTKPVDGLPFISSISTFRVTGAGSAQYLHQGAAFPPAGAEPTCPGTNGGTVTSQYLGSETKFVAAASLASTNEVILLDNLTAPTVLGYLIGGIAAWCPPVNGQTVPNCYASGQGTTCASSQIYQLTLDPGTATPSVELKAPAPPAAAGAPSAGR